MKNPLRRVFDVFVSEKSGKELNPYYHWSVREYVLSLDCGHQQVRARCVFGGDPAPEKLVPLLPRRVRCSDCFVEDVRQVVVSNNTCEMCLSWMRDDSPSEWFCSEECQERWNSLQTQTDIDKQDFVSVPICLIPCVSFEDFLSACRDLSSSMRLVSRYLPRATDWSVFGECLACGQIAGESCWDLRSSSREQRNSNPHRGRRKLTGR